MNNPEALATLGRKDTGRRQTKHKKENYKDEQNGPHQNPGCWQRVSGACRLLVYTSQV